MLHKFLLLSFISIGFSTANTSLNYNSNLTACPNINTSIKPHLDKLLGKWYVAILLYDGDIEDMGDESVCIKADFKYNNKTSLNQVWSFQPKSKEGGATYAIPTIVRDAAHWTANTHIGVPIHVTVVHAVSKSRMVLTFCADAHTGDVAHLWTAVLTRKRRLSNRDLVQLSALLLQLGYDPNSPQLITWHHC